MRNRFHALCPYFAMFPEEFAARWIDRLSRPNDILLDPFCGRGTLPFQALLMGRRAIGCDVNPVAFCVTRAKIRAPSLAAVQRRVRVLEASYSSEAWEAQRRILPAFFRVAYRPETLRQILFLRSSLAWRRSDIDVMIAAVVLGALHGESNRSAMYLSNQMPHTISTKPHYSVRYWLRHDFTAPQRNAFDLIRTHVELRYASPLPVGKGLALHLDMRDLSRIATSLPGPIGTVVTSPPYLDVTRSEEDQWLRLWFLGGPPHPSYGRVSRDDRHSSPEKYWGLIADFWRMLGLVLAPRANVVIRIGAVRMEPDQLVRALAGAAVMSRRRISLVDREVTDLKRRQTAVFRPGARGCAVEVDCHFAMA